MYPMSVDMVKCKTSVDKVFGDASIKAEYEIRVCEI